MDLRGSFCGIVEDNKDPEKLGRLKVRVPHVYGIDGDGVFGSIPTNDLPWALPTGLPNGMSQTSGGADWTPDIGDQVVVDFLDNEPEKPIWRWLMQSIQAAKTFQLHAYAKGPKGSVGAPIRGAWVRYGHTVEWNAEGLILTTSKGYRLLLTDASDEGNDGDISLATEAGQSFEFDDSTGDCTLNVNNNFNLNVDQQILSISDSVSMQTLTNEIELISGSDLTIETTDDLAGTIGGAWNMTVTGDTTFTHTGELTINGVQNIALKATENIGLTALGIITLTSSESIQLSSQDAMSIKSPANVNFDFLNLVLGLNATQPFVLGDVLLAYLQSLYTALITHTHAGVQSGPSNTGPMLPPPPEPTISLLSSVIKGK